MVFRNRLAEKNLDFAFCQTLEIAMYRALFIILLLAGSGLGRADTGSEGIRGKLPIDPPKRDNQPSFRLGCERGADGSEQIQLLVEGEKPIHLTGVDGESLGSETVIFDPASVSVRLLEGQPNLYWIQYEHQRTWEPGVANIDHRRHWVVRADNIAQTVFDRWTQPIHQFSRAGVYWDRSDNIALNYQGSILQVVETSSTRETWEEPPLSMESSCSEECGCPIQQAAEEWECPNKDCYSGCRRRLLADRNSEDALDKTVRGINAETGQTISQNTFWAKEYHPLRYRFARKEDEVPLSFLVLDDGISGWLVVRESDPEAPATTPVDPEHPSAIPAIAACWLYNRAPENAADATRTYPPAPPDHRRPPHFVPEACCVVETTADDNRTFLYEKVRDEKPGRLLAILDRSSQSCYSANLARDGRWGKALGQSVTPHERITLGSGVRLRRAPYAGAEEIEHRTYQGAIQRLSIGVVVLILGRSTATDHIDGVEDHWYYVVAPNRLAGWIFGGMLASFDSSQPEQAYRRVMDRYLASAIRGPAEEADFQAFLGRLRTELPKTATAVEGVEKDPCRLLAHFDEHLRICRTTHRAQDGGKILLQVEDVARHSRITLGSSVRMRPNPEPGCGQIERLPLGTVVSVRKHTVAAARIGGIEDRWYQVETPNKTVGWIFGGLLTSFDPADSERAHRKILERHFTVRAGALREEVEFLEFLARVRPSLPEALMPDFDLARLRGIARALAHFRWPSSPLDAPWMVERLAGVESDVVYLESADEWMLRPEAFWSLHERYRAHPAAERLAWAAAQAPKVGEGCEGDPACEIESLAEDDFIRYLGLYPSGAHASQANKAVDEILTDIQEALDLNRDYHSSPEFICQEDIHKAVQSALDALRPIQSARAAAVRGQLNKLLGATCPPPETQAGAASLAGASATASLHRPHPVMADFPQRTDMENVTIHLLPFAKGARGISHR